MGDQQFRGNIEGDRSVLVLEIDEIHMTIRSEAHSISLT
jgi:hypothetical protein